MRAAACDALGSILVGVGCADCFQAEAGAPELPLEPIEDPDPEADTAGSLESAARHL